MRTYTFFIVVWLIFSNICFSYPKGFPNIDILVDKAPVICVVHGVQEQQTKMSKMAIADAAPILVMELVTESEVINVFKGKLQKGDKIFIHGLASPSAPLEYLDQDEIAIVFLKHKEANNYEFTQREYSKLSIPCLNKDYVARGESVRKDIDMYVISLLYQLKDEKTIFQIYDLIIRLNIMVDANMINMKDVPDSPNIKAILLALFVRSGDNNAVMQSAEYLLSKDKELSREAIGVLGIISNSSYSKYVRLETAHRLASSDNPFIREIGITILRYIGNQDSIPIIINSLKTQNEGKMLKLVDYNIHLQAVWALYMITGIKMHKGDDTQIAEQVSQLRNQWLKWWEEKREK